MASRTNFYGLGVEGPDLALALILALVSRAALTFVAVSLKLKA